jgi:hypothetical protein
VTTKTKAIPDPTLPIGTPALHNGRRGQLISHKWSHVSRSWYYDLRFPDDMVVTLAEKDVQGTED